MLKMQFVVEMGITLMGIVYGLVVNLALFIYSGYSHFSVKTFCLSYHVYSILFFRLNLLMVGEGLHHLWIAIAVTVVAVAVDLQGTLTIVVCIAFDTIFVFWQTARCVKLTLLSLYTQFW